MKEDKKSNEHSCRTEVIEHVKRSVAVDLEVAIQIIIHGCLVLWFVRLQKNRHPGARLEHVDVDEGEECALDVLGDARDSDRDETEHHQIREVIEHAPKEV